MDQSCKEKLFQVADRQQGYFTSQQAQECGYHRSHFHRFLQSGEWSKELRGVYRLSHYPLQERGELVLWTLWSRNKKGEPQGIWSHETALDIYELTDVMPSKMHMSVPKGFRRNQSIPKVIALHFQNIEEDEVEIRQGYRLTSPLRTLLDVVAEGSISEDQVKMGLQQAINRGLITKRELQKKPYAQILLRYLDDI